MTNANPRVISLLRVYVQAASATAVLVGCLVLAGWMFDIAALKSVLPTGVTMKANTATAFVLAGASLWLMRTERAGPRRRRLGQLCACAVALVGLLTLGAYLFRWDLSIEQWLFHETAQAAGTSEPGRMAPTTALRWGAQAEPGAPQEAVDASTLAALRDLQGEGQPDLLAELIAVYLRDTPPRLAALHEAVAGADAGALRGAAHSLKGSSSQIGAVQMAQLCADLEEQARTANLADAAQTLPRLEAAFGRAQAHLQAVAGGRSPS